MRAALAAVADDGDLGVRESVGGGHGAVFLRVEGKSKGLKQKTPHFSVRGFANLASLLLTRRSVPHLWAR
jgi:hypothetical protein